MILTDYPIKDKNCDKLKRLPLAIRIAEVIKRFRGNESFVIGIEGVWGSGKTSLVNLVLEELKNDKIIIVNFNPWYFTGQNELIVDFFSTLSNLIKTKNNKDLIRRLSSYASKLQVSFRPTIPVPFFGSLGLGELWKNKNRTLQDERNDIDSKLKLLRKKIIIVVDDIDRLDKSETKLIMKLVKMMANFPNTIFLLAYDRNKVAERIQEDGWPGEEYLKKVIQVSFSLPKTDQLELRNILFSDLDETIKMVYGKVELVGDDKERWNEIFHHGFGDLFKTIRDIKRYINSLRLNWSIVNNKDVNQVDFMAIEAVRIFAPRVYSLVGANKEFFTNNYSLFSGLDIADNKEAKVQKFNDIIENSPAEIRESIRKICKDLFPQLDFSTNYSDWQQSWRSDKRICAEERFNFYFQLGIPEGSISESEIENILKTLSSKENFTNNLLQSKKEGKIRQVLFKILDQVKKLNEKQIEVLVSSLWDLEKQIDEEKDAIFDMNDVGTQVMRIAYQSVEKSVQKEKRFDLIKQILSNISTIYYPLKFISVLSEESEKGAEDALMERSELDQLKNILVERIEKESMNKMLENEEKLAYILFRWKKWAGAEKVESYIDYLLKEKSLQFLIHAFVHKVLSTAGNYNTIDKKFIGEVYPLDKLEKMVSDISDEEIEKMSNQDKEAILLFKNPPKD